MKKTALIVGMGDDLLMSLPFLFFRAGFEIDVLTLKTSSVRWSRYIKKSYVLDLAKSITDCCPDLAEKNYDWIIIADDPTLDFILRSSIDVSLKEKLLPVTSKEYFDHIFSKIGLSFRLQKNKILTPDFRVVLSKKEALEYLVEMNTAIIFKKDQSYAGRGNRLCTTINEVKELPESFFEKPVLAQKYIQGNLLHIGALYLNRKLVFFECAEIIKVIHEYGPSSIRRYVVNIEKHAEIQQELTLLGETLGAHGFANISCIQESSSNKRYYFEADMRTTTWLDFPRHYGNDPAKRIEAYFKNKETASYLPLPEHPFVPEYKVLSFGLRLPLWELIINRYDCWKSLLWEDPLPLLNAMKRTYADPITHFIRKIPSRFIERPIRLFVKKVYRQLIET